MRAKLVSLALRTLGIKQVIKLGWKYFLHPRLKKYAQNNEIKDWDETLLKLVDKYIYKIIDSI